MSITTLTDAQEPELYRLLRYYLAEAQRCQNAKAYLAGCVMLGSALEALLMLMINVYPEEAEDSGVSPMRKNKPIPLIEWNLGQLLHVAKTVGWLPSNLALTDDWNTRRAKIGDYAEITRMIRNLTHPGRYLKDHSRKHVTAKYMRSQFAIFYTCKEWLGDHNIERLQEHIEQEGLL